METIILLKLNVDSEHIKKPGETDDDIETKIRAYVTEIVGDAIEEQENYIRLIGSSVGVEILPPGTVRIKQSNSVIKLPNS